MASKPRRQKSPFAKIEDAIKAIVTGGQGQMRPVSSITESELTNVIAYLASVSPSAGRGRAGRAAGPPTVYPEGPVVARGGANDGLLSAGFERATFERDTQDQPVEPFIRDDQIAATAEHEHRYAARRRPLLCVRHVGVVARRPKPGGSTPDAERAQGRERHVSMYDGKNAHAAPLPCVRLTAACASASEQNVNLISSPGTS